MSVDVRNSQRRGVQPPGRLLSARIAADIADLKFADLKFADIDVINDDGRSQDLFHRNCYSNVLARLLGLAPRSTSESNSLRSFDWRREIPAGSCFQSGHFYRQMIDAISSFLGLVLTFRGSI